MTETNTTTPAVPEKPASQSLSMWTAVATFLLGVLTQMGVTSDLLDFINANLEDVVGAIMGVIGVVMAYATARRSTRIKL